MIKKIAYLVSIVFLVFGIMVLFSLAEDGNYPVERLRWDFFIAFTSGLNIIFVLPIIQKKVDSWASSSKS